jgi:RNA polymerase sigma factor (sigma-70 family)
MQAGPPDRRPGPVGDFATLLAGARANAPEAWERLYAWLAPGIAGYLRMLGAREVDDLTSEVLLAVFRRIASFEGSESSFRSWVFTVAHSRLIDERRRRNRRPDPLPLEAGFETAPAPTTTEDAAFRALEVVRIEAICAQLPDDQRAVILLRIIGELSVDQVAEVLHKSPGAVKQLQRRGFEKARTLFAQEGVTL